MLSLGLCFFLSGAAALLYQVAWGRQFALVFGTSELAIAAVLAAYMGGLALGAWAIERWLPNIRRPLHSYAALELGIALSALAVPVWLWLGNAGMQALLGGQDVPPPASDPLASAFFLLAAFIALMLPTALMGATLPLLARQVVLTEQQIGGRIGALYAANTAGAMSGALGGALWAVPLLGLRGTVGLGAGLNVAVAAVALWLARRTAAQAPAAAVLAAKVREAQAISKTGSRWVLWLIFLSGMVSFLNEVLWTRMLGHVLGSSLQAFGVMLASFLCGIAMGGVLGAWLARSRERSVWALSFSQLAIALAVVWAWWQMQHTGFQFSSQLERLSFGFLLLFPLACAIGVTFPLAVRIYTTDVQGAATGSARVYRWNTAGALLGSVAAGFVLLPWLNYEGAARLGASASAALAIACAFLLGRMSWAMRSAIASAAVVLVLAFRPATPEALLRYSPLAVSGEGELLHYGVGRNATVVALRQPEHAMLRSGGLPEASIELRGVVPQRYVESWMAPLAVLARPEIADLLVVGLGGGRVLEAIPESVRRIDVIELEPEVIAANRRLASERRVDPLADPRIRLIVNDARGSLALTTRRYDAIVSQPSHPWTAGASHLYTREFMRQVRSRLRPNGVFVQWMNVEFLDETLLRSLLATLAEVFPQVRVYRPAPTTLLFLAADAELAPELSAGRTAVVLQQSAASFAHVGLNSVEDLYLALALDDEGVRNLAAGNAPVTDNRNLFATASIYDLRRQLGAAPVTALFASQDPLLRPVSPIRSVLLKHTAIDYVARRLRIGAVGDAMASARLLGLSELAPDGEGKVYLQSQWVLRSGQPEQSREILGIGAGIYPQSSLLASALWAVEPEAGSDPAAVAARRALLRRAGPETMRVHRCTALAESAAWSELAGMDAELAAVPWTSQWRGRAAWCRALWRSAATDSLVDSSTLLAGIKLIDRELMIEPDSRLLQLRVMISARARLPAELAGSLSSYAHWVSQVSPALDNAARAQHRAALDRFASMMRELQPSTALPAARIDSLRQRLAAAYDALSRDTLNQDALN